MPSFAKANSVPSASRKLCVTPPFATLPNCVGVVFLELGGAVVVSTFGFTKFVFNGLFVISIGGMILPSLSITSPDAFLPTALLPFGPTGIPSSVTV